MKIYNMEQGTDEWFKVRIGKLTGSDFHIFFGESSTKENKIEQLCAERVFKTLSDTKKFSNKHIERGHELEDNARDLYQLMTGNIVEKMGFIELDETTGCSPDGKIKTGGLIEIKCKDNHTFFKQIRKGFDAIEPVHLTQMQFNMLVSGESFCDYICYNPNCTDLYIERIEIDDKRFKGKSSFKSIQEIKDKIIEINLEITNRIKDFNIGIEKLKNNIGGNMKENNKNSNETVEILNENKKMDIECLNDKITPKNSDLAIDKMIFQEVIRFLESKMARVQVEESRMKLASIRNDLTNYIKGV